MNKFDEIANNIKQLAEKYPNHYELAYTMPYETKEDIKKAEDLRLELYEHFNSVQVYPNGLYEVRIVAENAI